MGFRETINERLTQLGMHKNELAVRADVSVSYIYKLLMAGQGNRSNPSPEKTERIAAALGLTVNELYGAETLTDILLDALYALPAEERAGLRQTTARQRLLLASRIMSTDGRWMNKEQVATALDIPIDTYEAIIDGLEPEKEVIQTVADATGLSVRFWIRGVLDPHPRYVNQLLGHDDASDMLDLTKLIIESKVSASTIRNIVLAVVKGGAT